MNIKKLSFRYAANKREAAGTTFLLFSLFYFLAVQGLKVFMVPDLNAPIRAIMFNKGGYYAETGSQIGEEEPYKIRITKKEYEQFEFYGNVQLVLVGLYVVILFRFRKYYYDRKNWIGKDGA